MRKLARPDELFHLSEEPLVLFLDGVWAVIWTSRYWVSLEHVETGEIRVFATGPKRGTWSLVWTC